MDLDEMVNISGKLTFPTHTKTHKKMTLVWKEKKNKKNEKNDRREIRYR